MIIPKNICGCTDDIQCKESQRLSNLKSKKSKHRYSDHRKFALGIKIDGLTIWPISI